MSPAAAIDRGRSYLLARLRAQELVSLAPVDSPDKRYDGCGEPFLALDPIIAIGDRITDEDRQSLVARLLRSQWAGAWDYSGRRGIDVDTTSAAIRALDRLGHHISLGGSRGQLSRLSHDLLRRLTLDERRSVIHYRVFCFS